jgi:hypothetical protein
VHAFWTWFLDHAAGGILSGLVVAGITGLVVLLLHRRQNAYIASLTGRQTQEINIAGEDRINQQTQTLVTAAREITEEQTTELRRPRSRLTDKPPRNKDHGAS